MQTHEVDLKSKLAMKLKRQMMIALHERSFQKNNPEKQEEIFEKYQSLLIPVSCRNVHTFPVSLHALKASMCSLYRQTLNLFALPKGEKYNSVGYPQPRLENLINRRKHTIQVAIVFLRFAVKLKCNYMYCANQKC